MKTIQKAMIEQIYVDAMELAHKNKQAIHDESDKNAGSYYVTLAQLKAILKLLQD